MKNRGEKTLAKFLMSIIFTVSSNCFLGQLASTKSLEEFSIRPSEISGREFSASITIELFGEMEAVALDMITNAVENAITERVSGLSKVEDVDWTTTDDLGPVNHGLLIGQSFEVDESVLSSVVVEMSQGASGENPWSASVVVVALVATEQDTRNSGLVVECVDVVLAVEQAEEGVDGTGHVLAGRSKETIVEVGSVEGQNDGGVLLAVGGFEDKVAIPMGHAGRLDGVSGLLVALSAGRVTHGLSKLGADRESVAEIVAVPEEVGALDFFPQITAIGGPVGYNPIQIELDGAAVVDAGVTSPQVLSDKVLLAILQAPVGKDDQSGSAESRAIGLRTAPSARKDDARVGKHELGLDADVNTVGVGGLLVGQHPGGILLHLVDHHGRVVVGFHQGAH